MNKKIIYIIIILLIIVAVSLGYYFTIDSIDPFGSLPDGILPNYSIDPFGSLPKGTSPNCGPEDRYKFDVTINSKEDFVNFLKTHEINQWVSLDNFKSINNDMSYEDIKSAEINWNKVLNEIKIENTGSKIIYVLDYNPYTCFGFTLKMTTDGHVSVYGCCGE